ncbi:Crp/Fnr family transcriptional regulator [Lacrimispora sp. NSJ-141]|uniref:Crp/Fnr family transcriptional regulator n=1 Tax=Lientehia hominis TaxID=2897778 RepID=A0AAP2W7S5_9FIRM|nr:Crp/Fnr family transcriptional regulator [Lientehia hominis]MCD2491365.1 Crp/Fnr family transcriptional regulator [Lientehia hominis]
MIQNDRISILQTGFSFWEHLSEEEKEILAASCSIVQFEKETLIHRNDEMCIGMLLVLSGQIRTYILSDDGREVTLYRLFKGDTCILSASCVLDAVVFDVLIESVEPTEALLVPLPAFHQLMTQNVYVELFAYKLSTERFSDVMWTVQQILFMGADKRLAIFLWDEVAKTGEDTVSYTHDQIARYIGSAREVVSRMLKYFSGEGIVSLSRGKIRILDRSRLKDYL